MDGMYCFLRSLVDVYGTVILLNGNVSSNAVREAYCVIGSTVLKLVTCASGDAGGNG
jgi:hypothetical protein